MASLFESFKEIDIFYKYLEYYGRSNKSLLPKEQMEYFLRFWIKNKEHFFHAFDDNFILRRPIEYELNEDELIKNFNDIGYTNNYLIIEDYLVGLDKKIEDPELKEKLTNFIINTKDFALNTYSGETFIIPKKYTKDKKDFKINKGCKIIRMFKKILNILDIAEADYEDLRLAHARILNQKHLFGNLCLSIHPLDFVTMSDNTLGWDTCTSWTTTDPGEFRLGTLEMMNSPYVIIAYLELPNNPYPIGEYEWTNKHWRQLFILDKDIIIGNKQYNYQNDFFEGIALSWLKELCEIKLGWGPYIETPFRINNFQTIKVDKNYISVSLTTQSMYNDFGMNHKAYISEKCQHNSILIDYSGPATCIDCGRVIEKRADPINVECIECSGLKHCPCCDSYVYNYIDVNGKTYCYDCYSSYVCSHCGESIDEEKIYIDLIIDNNDNENYDFFNKKLVVELCPYCYSTIDADKINFQNNTINLLDLSDADLISLNLSRSTFGAIRDASTSEKRRELCSKFFSY